MIGFDHPAPKETVVLEARMVAIVIVSIHVVGECRADNQAYEGPDEEDDEYDVA